MYTIKQVSEKLNVHISTVYNIINKHNINTVYNKNNKRCIKKLGDVKQHLNSKLAGKKYSIKTENKKKIINTIPFNISYKVNYSKVDYEKYKNINLHKENNFNVLEATEFLFDAIQDLNNRLIKLEEKE